MGVGMRIKIYELRPKVYGRINKLEIECSGTGTIKDPIIIDNSVQLPSSFEIEGSELYIHIKDLKLEHNFSILKSRNITIENCEFYNLTCLSSSYLRINKCFFVNSLFRLVENSEFQDSIFGRITMEDFHDNIFKTCEIDRVGWGSKSWDNKFDDCDIALNASIKLERGITQKNSQIYFLSILLIVLGIFLVFFIYRKFESFIILAFIILMIIIFLDLLIAIIKSKSLENKPSNIFTYPEEDEENNF